MATIRERITGNGEKRYQAIVRLHGYAPESATFPSKTLAKKWVQQIEAAMREGRHFKTAESKKRTMNDLIDRYVDGVLPQKPKSEKKQAAQLEWWKAEIGFKTLADITPALIAEKRDLLAKNKAPATVVRYLAVISHAFTIAVKEWGWIDQNPLSKVRKPSEPRGRVRFLDDTERNILLNACRESSNEYLYPIVVLAISTGMRQGEILNLHWKQVDLVKGRIILEETKNGERRAVPLVSYAREILINLNKVRSIETMLLFPNKNDPIRPTNIHKHWQVAIKSTGIENFRFHDLRHTAASYLAMNGASIAEIAEVLGHKTLQMVKRYAHLSEQHTSSVVESMNNKIFL